MHKFISTTISIVAVFIIALTTTQVTAQSINTNKLGAGIMLGEPTGISLKLWHGGSTATQAGLAWSLSGNESIQVQLDHVWHRSLNTEGNDLLLYYGIGGRLIFSDKAKAGVRFPIGLNYFIPDTALDVFLEIAPIFNLIPDTGADGNGGIGIRYNF